MFRKMNIRTLAIIVVALVLLIIVVNLVKSGKAERSFKAELIDVDSSLISRVVISSLQQTEPISLIKEGETWNLAVADKTYKANKFKVDEILGVLASLKPKRVVALDKEEWQKYDLTDSLATVVEIFKNDKKINTLYVGRFNYQPPQGQAAMSNRQGTLTSYVRVDKDKEVYLVDGFLRMTFQQEKNSYRDNTVLISTFANWQKLTFSYPGDSSFVLERNNNTWLLDGQIADSNMVLEYFKRIEDITNSGFIDDVKLETAIASHTLTIQGDMTTPVVLSAYPADPVTLYYITSTMNPGTIFGGNSVNLFNRVFVSSKVFKKGE